MATGAGVFQAAPAGALRAGQVELHIAGHLRNVARAGALPASGRPALIAAGAVAGGALFVARDLDGVLRALDRLPESNVQAIFQISPFFRLFLSTGGRFPAPKKLAEDITKTTACVACTGRVTAGSGFGLGVLQDIRKIETAEIHVGVATAPRARTAPGGETAIGVKPYLVVHAALLRVIQNVIGFLHVLKAIFGRLIARIQIRVVLAREFPVRFPKFFIGSGPGNSQRLVIIVFWAGRHGI